MIAEFRGFIEFYGRMSLKVGFRKPFLEGAVDLPAGRQATNYRLLTPNY
jgi:hypothetical protein